MGDLPDSMDLLKPVAVTGTLGLRIPDRDHTTHEDGGVDTHPHVAVWGFVDQAGHEMGKGDKAVDPGDRTLLKISLSHLPPGTYKVIWRVLSVDTHTTEGDFKFTVAP